MRSVIRFSPLIGFFALLAACVLAHNSTAPGDQPAHQETPPAEDADLFLDLLKQPAIQKTAWKPAKTQRGKTQRGKKTASVSKTRPPVVASPNEFLSPPAPAEFPIPFRIPTPLSASSFPYTEGEFKPIQPTSFSTILSGGASNESLWKSSRLQDARTQSCCELCPAHHRALGALSQTLRRIGVHLAAFFPPLTPVTGDASTLPQPLASTAGDDNANPFTAVRPVTVQIAPPRQNAQSPRSAASQPLPSRSRALPSLNHEAGLNEILEIRQRLRINPLQGTILEQARPSSSDRVSQEAQREFVAALRKVVASTKTTEPLPLQLDAQITTPDSHVHAGQPHEDPDNDQTLAAILRTAGRKLDEKANELEDLKNYRRADELRDLAQHIREQARRIDFGEDDLPHPQRAPRYLRR